MDKEVWTTVNLYILLQSCFLGHFIIASFHTSVKHSEEEPHSVVHAEFNNWPKDIEENSINH